MLGCLGRLLAVPLIVVTGVALWSHVSPAPDASAQPHRAAPRHHAAGGGPSEGRVAIPSASPSSAAGSAGAPSFGEIASGLWRRLDEDMSATASGQQAMVRELSSAMRDQIDQLLRNAVSRPGR